MMVFGIAEHYDAIADATADAKSTLSIGNLSDGKELIHVGGVGAAISTVLTFKGVFGWTAHHDQKWVSWTRFWRYLLIVVTCIALFTTAGQAPVAVPIVFS